MNKINGGVTAAKGFRAASTAAGIKYKERDDMALILSDLPCRAAGVFTKNVVKAEPVLWDREIINSGKEVRAVVVNSGIANACTGTEGRKACEETAAKAADALGIAPSSVLLGSTGVIGMQLPVDRVKKGIEDLIPDLDSDLSAGTRAARAIMTTDTHPKEAAASFEIGGVTATIGGMAKGSGMIHPNMGTMLCYITTDTNISKELLQEALSSDIIDTFNMVSVDGDTSTNDTVLLLSNGAAGNPEITEKNDDYLAFTEALRSVTLAISRMIAGDGEGATALIEARVIHADTKDNARTLAKSVITSSLTKAAIFGHDANWGRILCALGYAGVDFNPNQMALSISAGNSPSNSLKIFEKGSATDYSEDKAHEILSEKEVVITADMMMGSEEATAFGCDLSYDYVKINADYRT